MNLSVCGAGRDSTGLGELGCWATWSKRTELDSSQLSDPGLQFLQTHCSERVRLVLTGLSGLSPEHSTVLSGVFLEQFAFSGFLHEPCGLKGLSEDGATFVQWVPSSESIKATCHFTWEIPAYSLGKAAETVQVLGPLTLPCRNTDGWSSWLVHESALAMEITDGVNQQMEDGSVCPSLFL